jgi:hypothetical protein
MFECWMLLTYSKLSVRISQGRRTMNDFCFSSSDIQRKVTLIISQSTSPRFPPSAPKRLVAHTRVLCFLGSARPRGNIKAFCIGGVTPLWRVLEWKLRM